MKSTRKLRAEREKFQSIMDAGRKEHEFEAGLFKQHPHEREVGEALAKKYVGYHRVFAD